MNRSVSFSFYFLFVYFIISIISFKDQARAATESLVFVTFFLDEEVLGEIPTYPDENFPENSEVLYSSLIEALTPIVQPSVFESWKPFVHSNRIKIKDLNGIVEAKFNINSLEVYVAVPAAKRSLKGIALGYRSRKNQKAPILHPSSVSGYFNFMATKPSNSSFYGGVDSFLNMSGLILEDNRQYFEVSPHPWRRTGSRLIMDDPQQLRRYSLGDIKYSVVGFQTVVNIGGLSINKNFNLSPLAKSIPQSRTSFLVTQSSTVDVYVNGHLYRTLQLKAGRYELNDLPLSYGFNDIELVIQDVYGKIEKLNFPYVYTSELLNKGEHKYSHNVGATSDLKEFDIEYDQENIVYSGFHHVGLTDDWTFGFSVQNNKKQSLFGLESFWGTHLGSFNLELAQSRVFNFVDDWAGRFRFRSWSRPKDWIRDWGWGVESYGSHFATFGQSIESNLMESLMETLVDNRGLAIVDIFFSPALFSSWQTTLNLSRRFMRTPSSDIDSVSLKNSKSLQASTFFSVDLSYSVDPNLQQKEWKCFFSLLWTDPVRKFNQLINYEGASGAKHYDLQKTIDKNTFNLAIDDRSPTESASVRGYRPAQRYNFSADYSVIRDKNTKEQTENGNLNFATAYAWTSDGGHSWMAPIYDSFAIFDLGEGLQNKIIEVNRTALTSDFSSEGWHSLVINNVSSYRERIVNLEVFDDDKIAELDESVFNLRPTYRSGFYKKLNLFSNFVVRGRILNWDEKAWGLQVGELKSLKDHIYPISFFTNRDGDFEVERILPGNYIMSFLSEDISPIEILINEGSGNVQDLGIIKLKKR